MVHFIDRISQSEFPRNHLVGWIVIVGKGNESVIERKIDLGLQSFMGDYGLNKITQIRQGFGFGLWKPETPLPLSTWSFFDDRENCCFLDGVFYEEYFHHQPLDGEDQYLSELFLRKFIEIKHKAIEALNGSFNGFIYNYKSKELITFIDRLGTKILFWSYEKGDVIVTTNLAAFRALKSLELDEKGAFQFLTIGFPIGERSLLNDVMIQLPCTMNIYHGTVKESVRYWGIPERLKSITLSESVEMISKSMEDHVDRIYSRAKQRIGLGMSGGHDSRVVCSALAYKNIPFTPLTWKDYNFNDNIVPRLCSIINKQALIVKDIAGNQLDEIQRNVFIYSDGYYLNSYGFPRLAKACCEQHIGNLMVGFSGDKIGGSLTIPDPRYLSNIEQLALCSLNNQMELLSFRDAQLLKRNMNSDLIQETISEWLESFTKENDRGYLSDSSILQGLSNRNLKRVRFAIIPAQQYTQLLFPYLDNEVLDAYFSLPIQFLTHQKAHCYAGFYRFKEFGNYQANNYHISLAKEAFSPFVLYLLRLSRLKLSDLLSLFKSSGYKGDWKELHYKIYDEISKSPLFDSGFLKRLFLRKKIKPKDLYKIHTLSRFYDFYICGNKHYVPQRFVKNQNEMQMKVQ